MDLFNFGRRMGFICKHTRFLQGHLFLAHHFRFDKTESVTGCRGCFFKPLVTPLDVAELAFKPVCAFMSKLHQS